ncbi:tRNA (5-methylaminomethyl-2-thiouridine)(34)-methyltransferase MnmD [Flavobacterium aciduliphilum]|uniref:tRNA U34 5-methylaminomethyl-2-thiouridine-forming methyltransferase MnmC n=1 Tax=Flavobacterium aciduliphilum TaxID=1101402 RepID=A0A328Y7H3_9FLAO|nr:tRNA (5-methylaminomethyl-2-thiouridine)(34)-methyltransferase MnmD [Flavobacterium aciduliphilum]RAR70041.1 tRNA U34 5-methylaminomethyl-2-thiouridine-forming methyltransferase MnmC [Flavobacterium aciduliphilum]
MKREIIQTQDGSASIFIPEWNESYHSKHGAIQEAYHVFIKNGLSLFQGDSISILEIGFGTGLNAFITLLEAEKNNQAIAYVGVEAFPVSIDEVSKMNYPEALNVLDKKNIFESLHDSLWENQNQLTSNFSLTKRKQFFHEISDVNQFDLIYFDAFGYRVQPELWSVVIFEKMYQALRKEGVLVTYACRSIIKNAMLEAGFSIEKLPGAPGKREMLRAIKK